MLALMLTTIASSGAQQRLTSIFLLSLFSVISLMLLSMRLLYKRKVSVHLDVNNDVGALVHFAANVF